MEIVKEIIFEFWGLLVEMAPYLLLGFLFAGLLNGLIPKKYIVKHLGKSNFSSVVKAAIFGIPLPLCSCGVIPTGISFRDHGASNGATISFLTSTPQTGVDSILATYSLMNWPWAVIKPIVALFSGVISGLVVNQVASEVQPKEVFKEEEASDKKGWFDRIFRYAFIDFMSDISRWLLLGLFLAALIAVFIPDELFQTSLSDPYLNMGIMLIASIPVYVCATGSIPIAATLLLKGMNPGAVLVFLLAGPATNLATITVIWKSMGKKIALIYVGGLMILSIFFGIIIDQFFGFLDLDSLAIAEGHHNHEEISVFGYIMASILSGLLIFVEVKKLLPAKKIKAISVKKFKVEGMTCNHCKASVENVIFELGNVKEVVADPNSDTVQVDGEVDEEAVKKAVESRGYQYKGKL
ncbi:MAG: permease [Crocinitomicaceae bacterium]|nr:permease [Crocinitomicaceae bacterium]